MMSEHERAAEAVLEGLVPIGDDHPRVQAFEEAMVEHLAHRPSPESPELSQADRIEQKLDAILDILQGGSS